MVVGCFVGCSDPELVFVFVCGSLEMCVEVLKLGMGCCSCVLLVGSLRLLCCGGRSCECLVLRCFVSCSDFEVVFVLCVSWASELVGWLEVGVESLGYCVVELRLMLCCEVGFCLRGRQDVCGVSWVKLRVRCG